MPAKNLRVNCAVCEVRSPYIGDLKGLGWQCIRAKGEFTAPRWYCPTCPKPERAAPPTRPPSKFQWASRARWPNMRRANVHMLPGETGRVLFAFGYESIAKAVGMHLSSIRGALEREEFDPLDLASLARWIMTRERFAEPEQDELDEHDIIHAGRADRGLPPLGIDALVAGFHALGFTEPKESEDGTHVAIGRDLFSVVSATRLLAHMREHKLATLSQQKLRTLAVLRRLEKRERPKRPARAEQVVRQLAEFGVQAEVRDRDTLRLACWVVDVERAAELVPWLRAGGELQRDLLTALDIMQRVRDDLAEARKAAATKRKVEKQRRLRGITKAARDLEAARAEAASPEAGSGPAEPAASGHPASSAPRSAAAACRG